MTQLTPPLKYPPRSKPIPGFPGYRASRDGSIWSCLKLQGSHWHGDTQFKPVGAWKQLKPDRRKEDGRKRYTLRHEDGKYRRKYGAHFVLITFVGPCSEGMETCHWDGDCLNDSSKNLRWGTRQENADDKQRHGTQIKGATHHKAKLSDTQIDEILVLRRSGEKLAAIGTRYGVTETRVYQIAKKGRR